MKQFFVALLFVLLASPPLEAQVKKTFNLTWQDRSDNEAGFKLYRDGTFIKDIPPNTASTTDQVSGMPLQGFHYELSAWSTFEGSLLESDKASAIGILPGIVVVMDQNKIASISRRLDNGSSVIAILVNANQTVGPQGLEISYPSGKLLDVSRRAIDTSSVVAFLINRDEAISVNGKVQ